MSGDAYYSQFRAGIRAALGNYKPDDWRWSDVELTQAIAKMREDLEFATEALGEMTEKYEKLLEQVSVMQRPNVADVFRNQVAEAGG